MLAAQPVADRPQAHVGDLRALHPDPVLDPGQHLHHYERRQAAQADPPPFGDRPADQAPARLASAPGPSGSRAPAGPMRMAVPVRAVRPAPPPPHPRPPATLPPP